MVLNTMIKFHFHHLQLTYISVYYNSFIFIIHENNMRIIHAVQPSIKKQGSLNNSQKHFIFPKKARFPNLMSSSFRLIFLSPFAQTCKCILPWIFISAVCVYVTRCGVGSICVSACVCMRL